MIYLYRADSDERKLRLFAMAIAALLAGMQPISLRAAIVRFLLNSYRKPTDRYRPVPAVALASGAQVAVVPGMEGRSCHQR